MLTAETITDEQIHELCGDTAEHHVIANIALRGPDGWMTEDDVRVARARCAELLNARHLFQGQIAQARAAFDAFRPVNPNFARAMADSIEVLMSALSGADLARCAELINARNKESR